MTATERGKAETHYHEFPFRTKCDRIDDEQTKVCHFNQVFKTMEQAEWAEQTHEHPFPHELVVSERYMSMTTKLWERMDEVVDKLKSATLEGAELENLKGEARGLAFAMQLTMVPYYETVAEVSRESLERWKMRNQKIPFRMTPGYKFSPPPQAAPHGIPKPDGPAPVITGSGSPIAATSTGGRRRTSSQPAAPKKQLTEADVASIKKGLESGMFKVSDFSKVFGVTEADIDAAAKS